MVLDGGLGREEGQVEGVEVGGCSDEPPQPGAQVGIGRLGHLLIPSVGSG
ncbi:hypothetical protein IBJ60_19445 [Nocardioides sp. zg-578]|nr:hypothetical protein [Nocardioides marmotae]